MQDRYGRSLFECRPKPGELGSDPGEVLFVGVVDFGGRVREVAGEVLGDITWAARCAVDGIQRRIKKEKDKTKSKRVDIGWGN